MAKISNPFESLIEKIWVVVIVTATKIPSNSKEKAPVAEVIIKNQKVNPAVTASALNLGEENSILNRINERHKAALS